MNPLDKVNDEVAIFFRGLGYTVDWDFKWDNGERWYQIEDGEGVICQPDLGVPLADLIEDFVCLHEGREPTSKTEYSMWCEPNSPRFKKLAKLVAESGVRC